MTNTHDKPTANEESENAINKVLEKEQVARNAIDEVKNQAQEILKAAHAKAQRIRRKGDERIRNIHLICDTAIANEIKNLQHAYAQAEDTSSLNSHTDEILSKAVADVANQLIKPNQEK